MSIFFVIFFLLVSPAYADVQQGSATSTVDVQTSIGGSGSVSTHVETNVNGHTQNFDSTQPGSYHIVNNGTTSSVTNNSTGTSITIPPSPMITFSPSPTHKLETHRTNSPESLWSRIKDFFTSFFRFRFTF